MIHEVDEGLRLLLAAQSVPADGVELVFEAPTKEWAAKRNAPTVSAYLYDLREELGRRRTGSLDVVDADGTVLARRGPPHWYQLSYLLTAWTARPEDEHRLLSDVLRAVSRYEALDGDLLVGSLAELGLAVPLESAGPLVEATAATEIWTALGGTLKPAISLRVLAPLAGDLTPVGPPVTEGLVVRTGQLEDEATDEVDGGSAGESRRLRYDGPTTAEGEGFAVGRPRPDARRRRGVHR